MFCSLNDRKPINADDDVVVLVSPDYQGLADVQRIAVALVDGDDGPVSFLHCLLELKLSPKVHFKK